MYNSYFNFMLMILEVDVRRWTMRFGKILGEILVCFFLLFAGADSHPAHGETHFDGWERPVLWPDESFVTELRSDVITEEIFSDTQDACTIQNNGTDTQEPPKSFEIPVIYTGDPLMIDGESGVLYPIYLQWKPVEATCGLIFIIESGKNSDIYAVTPENIPTELCLTYVIDDGRAAVLMDGMMVNEEGFNGILCYVAVGGFGKSPEIHIKEYLPSI